MTTTELLNGAAATGDNLPALSVSEISSILKRAIEGAFDCVRVRGEVSGLKRHGSGHVYFCLKDEGAVLDAVCWRTTAARLTVAPQDGLEVIATGRLTTYPGRSKYQMVVDRLEPAGEGALLRMLEERKRRLAAEGLFDADRKRPLPYLPEVIGVVTSPSGAVIRDILHRLADRFPRRVLLWPVAVQGDGAAEQVAAAITGFNAMPADGPIPRPDVLIVARGGGSLEDLWAFNEEVVVRAAAASAIPLISAVGHETDTTLIDHAADRRAPTPTAAAEMAVPVRLELKLTIDDLETRLFGTVRRLLVQQGQMLIALGRGLPHPRAALDAACQRYDDVGERLVLAASRLVERGGERLTELRARLRPEAFAREIALKQEQVTGFGERLACACDRALADRATAAEQAAKLLASLDHRQVLRRGFALVRDADGALITRAAATRPGSLLSLEFADGRTEARVEGAAGARARRARPSAPGNGQGRLFHD